MSTPRNKFLFTHISILRKIKTAQFVRQIPAIILLWASFLLNYAFPALELYTLALIIALTAIVWNLFISMNYRFKRRIPTPPENAILSPLQGKIRFIRGNEETLLLSIRKIFLDRVEIRAPLDNCRREEDMLKLTLGDKNYSFRFNAKNIRWFDYAEMKSGNVIGTMVGSGTCTVSMPGNSKLELVEGRLLDSGEPILEFEDDQPQAVIIIE
ncbi:MAG: hypothetical protein Q8M98_11125 [Candidatus Cloacimonadaceae bacterium]|nr:hypothetical protein [Candidatus Cloacimonadaceae bacterium]MDP3115304.1 hypothetical protein [Candidatus Cloacimonadaceae bacterium]